MPSNYDNTGQAWQELRASGGDEAVGRSHFAVRHSAPPAPPPSPYRTGARARWCDRDNL